MANPKQLEPPKLSPCKCGSAVHIVLLRSPRHWGVYCINPVCGHCVTGYDTDTEAIEAWKKEEKPIGN